MAINWREKGKNDAREVALRELLPYVKTIGKSLDVQIKAKRNEFKAMVQATNNQIANLVSPNCKSDILNAFDMKGDWDSGYRSEHIKNTMTTSIDSILKQMDVNAKTTSKFYVHRFNDKSDLEKLVDSRYKRFHNVIKGTMHERIKKCQNNWDASCESALNSVSNVMKKLYTFKVLEYIDKRPWVKPNDKANAQIMNLRLKSMSDSLKDLEKSS